LIFVFAAVVTPPDLISQIIMALPLMGLYELSILLARVFGKKSKEVTSEEDTKKEAVSASP